MNKVEQEEGIYFFMPEEVYHNSAGLSCSGMKQLAVSPLNYWHCNINKEYQRPEETSQQRFGKAVHSLVLEPGRFNDCYATALSQDDFPGALVTVEDMKGWLSANELPATAKRKQDLIDRITGSGLSFPPIWDVEYQKAAELTSGKVVLKKEEMAEVRKAAAVIAADSCANGILSGGMPEVSFFVREPETGVMLKARMDYVKPTATIDLKTFSNSRGKPTDRVVFDAIYYEGYHLQCVVYYAIRELARRKYAAGEITTFGNVSEEWLKGFIEYVSHGFGFVFIESGEPFDLRVIELRRSEAAGAGENVYWSAAAMKMVDLTQLYAECMDRYGEEPWREPCKPHVMADTDIPQLMFAA